MQGSSLTCVQVVTALCFASASTAGPAALTLKATMEASAAAASCTSDCVTGPMPEYTTFTRTCRCDHAYRGTYASPSCMSQRRHEASHTVPLGVSRSMIDLCAFVAISAKQTAGQQAPGRWTSVLRHGTRPLLSPARQPSPPGAKTADPPRPPSQRRRPPMPAENIVRQHRGVGPPWGNQ